MVLEVGWNSRASGLSLDTRAGGGLIKLPVLPEVVGPRENTSHEFVPEGGLEWAKENSRPDRTGMAQEVGRNSGASGLSLEDT